MSLPKVEGRQIDKMKERDVNAMTPNQLGKIRWDDDAFDKFVGFNKATKKLNGDDRTLVHTRDVDNVLEDEYEDVPPNIGRDTFYEIVNRKFVGVSRRKVQDFLKLQPIYQKSQRRIIKSMAKSITSKRPFERIQIDTIDSSKLGSSPFTLTVIDTFSKFTYAEPLKDHTSKTTSNALI